MWPPDQEINFGQLRLFLRYKGLYFIQTCFTPPPLKKNLGSLGRTMLKHPLQFPWDWLTGTLTDSFLGTQAVSRCPETTPLRSTARSRVVSLYTIGDRARRIGT